MTTSPASSLWSWLEDTYWYVPPESLPALRFDKDGVGSQTNAHWAYMVRVRPGDPSWDSLLGIGLSVPRMLKGWSRRPSNHEDRPVRAVEAGVGRASRRAARSPA